MQEPTDDEWLRAALAGDKTAYSQLVRRHQRPLLRYLVRMVGSPDDAMELTQEAFVRAWQALPQWQPDAQFRTWLFRIASNAALDVLRRRKTVQFVPLDDVFETPDPGPGPERQAQATQELRQLEIALSRMSPEHREILLLREIEDMSYEEIGRVLSLSDGTVKSRLARARLALIEQPGEMPRKRRDCPRSMRCPVTDGAGRPNDKLLQAHVWAVRSARHARRTRQCERVCCKCP